MKNLNHKDLYKWCVELAQARRKGTLSQEQIDKLNSLNFPWAYYEDEFDQLMHAHEQNEADEKV